MPYLRSWIAVSGYPALAVWLLAAIGCAATPGADQTAERYLDFGIPIPSTAPSPVAIDEVMAEPEAYAGSEVVLRGTVRDVCQKRGCWMTMGADRIGDSVIVKFTCPIEGHLIPAEAKGQVALAAGKLEYREVNEAYARHLAKDNGASPEEINKIVGPQRMLWLGAPSARVYGLSE